MTYGYIRVSTDKQTVENQRFEINNFCSREQIQIDGWIEETISGTKAYNKRTRQTAETGGERRPDSVCRTVPPRAKPVYDNGDTEYMHDQRVPRMDYQRQLPPRR